jgi:hypothetical protein
MLAVALVLAVVKWRLGYLPHQVRLCQWRPILGDQEVSTELLIFVYFNNSPYNSPQIPSRSMQPNYRIQKWKIPVRFTLSLAPKNKNKSTTPNPSYSAANEVHPKRALNTRIRREQEDRLSG